ncbi:MAG: hypothetical protein Q8O75_04050 [bacterium]|nr:hypothetical protein [bacterium]
MIYLVHGQNQVDSRRFLIRLKNGYQNIETINAKNLGEKKLQNIFRQVSHPIFKGKSALLIEHFAGNWKGFPKKTPEDFDIILWADEKIQVGPLPVKNLLFNKLQKASAFKLVDALLFKNERSAQVLLFELLFAKEPTEKIIGALARSFFLVYCAKRGSLHNINLPLFAKEKIQDQAKGWSQAGLKKTLVQLLGVDLALKEGAQAKPVLTAFISRVVSY